MTSPADAGREPPIRQPRGLVVLLGLAGALVAVLALRQLAWLLAPVCLAVMIVLLVHPLHGWLSRHRLPTWLPMLIVLLAIYALVIGLVGVLVFAIARLAALLPGFSAQAAELVTQVTALAAELGVSREQVRTVLAGVDLSGISRWLTSLLSSLLSLGANAVLLLTLLLFLGIESSGASKRLAEMARTRPRTTEALRQFARRSRRFIAVTTVFAILVGAADTVFLLIVGIPLAAVWGLLAAVCNYIPYVGFVIGVIPPALLALLIGGWESMVLVIVVYILLNSLITSLLPPYFVGDAVELSMVVVLLSVVFWAWVLGPVGAILAVPLTLLVKALLVDADPAAAWAQALLGPMPRHAGRRRLFRSAADS